MAKSSAEVRADSVEDGPTWQRQIAKDGTFQRRDAVFRHAIEARPDAEFQPEASRYHLYVSLACPWAHRALILRRLKGLEHVLSYDVVDWFLPHDGWTLEAKTEGATLDTVNGAQSLRDIYKRVEPGYRGSVTVPTLWDKKCGTIVNNESSEIIRMLNSEFNDFATRPEYDFYPTELRSQIEEINAWVYPDINNGVYCAGFARSQSAYDAAVTSLFDSMERAERILEKNRYLTGGRLTEADIRLWTTLIRFDSVYVTHFKCNWKRLVDYPHLWGFTRELYAHPAFRETTDFTHIKRHYFESHESINPYRIVPLGPSVDYDAAHGRDHLPVEWFPAAC
jgi:putative glutathione S-transferase